MRDQSKYTWHRPQEPAHSALLDTFLRWLPMPGPCFKSAAVLVAFGLGLLMAQSVKAEDWRAPDLPCVPTVSDYEHGYKIEGAAFAIVWWCDDDTGLLTRWYTGTAPGAVTPASQAAALVSLAGRDPEAFLAAAFKRESTPSEMELVRAVEAQREPRCYVTGTGSTAAVVTGTAQHAVGPAKLDATGVAVRIPVGQRVQCMSRLAKEPRRYCEVTSAPDSKQRLIEGEAFAACKIERAPKDGW